MTVTDALGHTLPVPAMGSMSDPQVGDAWVVTINGADKACVLVAGVRETFVTAWPITAEDGAAAWPAFPIEIQGMPRVAVWPQAQFTIAMSALGRRVAQPLGASVIRDIGVAVAEQHELPVAAYPSVETHEALDALDAVCLVGWSVGAWEWPSRSNGVLDQDALRAHSVDARALRAILHASPGEASRLYSGERVPTDAQMNALLGALPPGTPREAVLRKPTGLEADLLMHPRFKERVERVRQLLSTTEGKARSAIWEHAIATAARQATHVDPRLAAQERVDDAINRLLADDNA